MRDLTEMNLWDEDMKNQMISSGGSIQVRGAMGRQARSSRGNVAPQS